MVIKIDKVFSVELTISAGGFFNIGEPVQKTSYMKGKHYAMYYLGNWRNDWDHHSRTPYRMESISKNTLCPPEEGVKKKVFVSRQSKFPRDILRNSGYTIVLDKNKADYIIIPDLGDMVYSMCDYICEMSNGDTVLVDIYDRSSGTLPSDVYASIDDFLKKELRDPSMIINKPDYRGVRSVVCFMNGCEEYLDIDGKNSVTNICPYVFESGVATKPSYEINPENLKLWNNLDVGMLEKVLMQSNGKEYPFTLGRFLYNYRKSTYGLSYSTRNMLKGWGALDFATSLYPSGTVSAKDFEMYQKYVFSVLGMPENGGWVDKSNSKFSSFDNDLLQKKIYLKPIKLNRRASIREIYEFTRNGIAIV